MATDKKTNNFLKEVGFDNIFEGVSLLSDDYLMVIDLDFKIQYINHVRSDYTEEQVLGTSIYDFIPKDSQEESKIAIDNCLSKKERQQYRTKAVHPSGESSWYDVEIGPLIRDGEVVAILMISKDITENKLIRDKSTITEQLYKDIVENSPDMIHSVDEKGSIVFANKREAEVLGYSNEELLKLNIKDLYSKKLWNDVQEGFKTLKNEGAFYVPEGTMLDKSGKEIQVEIDSIAIYDDKGDFLRTRSIIRDLTERKKADKQLKLFSQAIEASIDGINITDMQGNLIYMNAASEHAYGYEKGELLGQHVEVLNAEKGHNDEIIPDTLEGGWTGELIEVRKDGTTFPISLSTSVIKNESGQSIGMIGVVRDISNVKETETELKKRVDQMEFMGRINLKRHKKMMEMQKEIIDLKKRLGEDVPDLEDLDEFNPEKES